MSDTPRTDDELRESKHGTYHVVPAELARQLERELAVSKGLEQMAYDQRDKAWAAARVHDVDVKPDEKGWHSFDCPACGAHCAADKAAFTAPR